jgi:hypothetical protein
MTLEFLEVCGPYEPVYEPFFAGFEEDFNVTTLKQFTKNKK